jgi:hypothetical protein
MNNIYMYDTDSDDEENNFGRDYDDISENLSFYSY